MCVCALRCYLQHGVTVLMRAAWGGHKRVVRLLLKAVKQENGGAIPPSVLGALSQVSKRSPPSLSVCIYFEFCTFSHQILKP